jgi:hypothetical protein
VELSGLEELVAAQQDGGNPLRTLAVMLGLAELEVQVTGVKMFGRGAAASIDIELSNGETMSFPSVREMVRPGLLLAEVVACSGATPKLDQRGALQVVKLARQTAERRLLEGEDAISRTLGIEFLQQADVLDFRLDDQVERWRAFEQLERRDPWAHVREFGTSFPGGCLVLRDGVSGVRLLRAEWFLRHVRSMAPRETPASVRMRMERVGWQRRGSEGRIKATAPGRAEARVWAFWLIPAGWENE